LSGDLVLSSPGFTVTVQGSLVVNQDVFLGSGLAATTVSGPFTVAGLASFEANIGMFGVFQFPDNATRDAVAGSLNVARLGTNNAYTGINQFQNTVQIVLGSGGGGLNVASGAFFATRTGSVITIENPAVWLTQLGLSEVALKDQVNAFSGVQTFNNTVNITNSIVFSNADMDFNNGMVFAYQGGPTGGVAGAHRAALGAASAASVTVEIATAFTSFRNLPVYSSHNAADADASLPSKSFYKRTSGRQVFQKP
jgi:hypothetical protein